jgi:hypothetical protein
MYPSLSSSSAEVPAAAAFAASSSASPIDPAVTVRLREAEQKRNERRVLGMVALQLLFAVFVSVFIAMQLAGINPILTSSYSYLGVLVLDDASARVNPDPAFLSSGDGLPAPSATLALSPAQLDMPTRLQIDQLGTATADVASPAISFGSFDAVGAFSQAAALGVGHPATPSLSASVAVLELFLGVGAAASCVSDAPMGFTGASLLIDGNLTASAVSPVRVAADGDLTARSLAAAELRMEGDLVVPAGYVTVGRAAVLASGLDSNVAVEMAAGLSVACDPDALFEAVSIVVTSSGSDAAIAAAGRDGSGAFAELVSRADISATAVVGVLDDPFAEGSAGMLLAHHDAANYTDTTLVFGPSKLDAGAPLVVGTGSAAVDHCARLATRPLSGGDGSISLAPSASVTTAADTLTRASQSDSAIASCPSAGGATEGCHDLLIEVASGDAEFSSISGAISIENLDLTGAGTVTFACSDGGSVQRLVSSPLADFVTAVSAVILDGQSVSSLPLPSVPDDVGPGLSISATAGGTLTTASAALDGSSLQLEALDGDLYARITAGPSAGVLLVATDVAVDLQSTTISALLDSDGGPGTSLSPLLGTPQSTLRGPQSSGAAVDTAPSVVSAPDAATVLDAPSSDASVTLEAADGAIYALTRHHVVAEAAAAGVVLGDAAVANHHVHFQPTSSLSELAHVATDATLEFAATGTLSLVANSNSTQYLIISSEYVSAASAGLFVAAGSELSLDTPAASYDIGGASVTVEYDIPGMDPANAASILSVVSSSSISLTTPGTAVSSLNGAFSLLTGLVGDTSSTACVAFDGTTLSIAAPAAALASGWSNAGANTAASVAADGLLSDATAGFVLATRDVPSSSHTRPQFRLVPPTDAVDPHDATVGLYADIPTVRADADPSTGAYVQRGQLEVAASIAGYAVVPDNASSDRDSMLSALISLRADDAASPVRLECVAQDIDIAASDTLKIDAGAAAAGDSPATLTFTADDVGFAAFSTFAVIQPSGYAGATAASLLVGLNAAAVDTVTFDVTNSLSISAPLAAPTSTVTVSTAGISLSAGSEFTVDCAFLGIFQDSTARLSFGELAAPPNPAFPAIGLHSAGPVVVRYLDPDTVADGVLPDAGSVTVTAVDALATSLRLRTPKTRFLSSSSDPLCPSTELSYGSEAANVLAPSSALVELDSVTLSSLLASLTLFGDSTPTPGVELVGHSVSLSSVSSNSQPALASVSGDGNSGTFSLSAYGEALILSGTALPSCSDGTLPDCGLFSVALVCDDNHPSRTNRGSIALSGVGMALCYGPETNPTTYCRSSLALTAGESSTPTYAAISFAATTVNFTIDPGNEMKVSNGTTVMGASFSIDIGYELVVAELHLLSSGVFYRRAYDSAADPPVLRWTGADPFEISAGDATGNLSITAGDCTTNATGLPSGCPAGLTSDGTLSGSRRVFLAPAPSSPALPGISFTGYDDAHIVGHDAADITTLTNIDLHGIVVGVSDAGTTLTSSWTDPANDAVVFVDDVFFTDSRHLPAGAADPEDYPTGCLELAPDRLSACASATAELNVEVTGPTAEINSALQFSFAAFGPALSDGSSFGASFANISSIPNTYGATEPILLASPVQFGSETGVFDVLDAASWPIPHVRIWFPASTGGAPPSTDADYGVLTLPFAPAAGSPSVLRESGFHFRTQNPTRGMQIRVGAAAGSWVKSFTSADAADDQDTDTYLGLFPMTYSTLEFTDNSGVTQLFQLQSETDHLFFGPLDLSEPSQATVLWVDRIEPQATGSTTITISPALATHWLTGWEIGAETAGEDLELSADTRFTLFQPVSVLEPNLEALRLTDATLSAESASAINAGTLYDLSEDISVLSPLEVTGSLTIPSVGSGTATFTRTVGGWPPCRGDGAGGYVGGFDWIWHGGGHAYWSTKPKWGHFPQAAFHALTDQSNWGSVNLADSHLSRSKNVWLEIPFDYSYHEDAEILIGFSLFNSYYSSVSCQPPKWTVYAEIFVQKSSAVDPSTPYDYWVLAHSQQVSVTTQNQVEIHVPGHSASGYYSRLLSFSSGTLGDGSTAHGNDHSQFEGSSRAVFRLSFLTLCQDQFYYDTGSSCWNSDSSYSCPGSDSFPGRLPWRWGPSHAYCHLLVPGSGDGALAMYATHNFP